MNLAEQLRIKAAEVKLSQNQAASQEIIKLVKDRAQVDANNGKTKLVVNLKPNGWTLEQAKLAIEELSKDGFSYEALRAEGCFHYMDQLHVSWD
jgi:hypothetical protein